MTTTSESKLRPRVVMGIPTLRRYDLLRVAVTTALQGTVTPERVVIIDNGAGIPDRILQELQSVSVRANVVVEIERRGRNIGVAASWNRVADLAPDADFLLIANDDTTTYPGTLARLLLAAEAEPRMPFFFPASGGFKNAWSYFLQRRSSWETIGPYDEYISPNYGFFEDNDYSERLRRAGLRHVPVPHCAYGHVDSATVKSMGESELRDHWARFELARQNYIAKWGGLPGHEVFDHPFDGKVDRPLRMPAPTVERFTPETSGGSYART